MTSDLQAGRRDRVDGLLPAVYEELRIIARRQLSKQESEGTFFTTGLVHDACERSRDDP
jgi:hypothetical protein